MAVWIKTKHQGVRFREHPIRKHGVRKDRYYSIRYKLNGKDREESLGWESQWPSKEKGRSLEQEAVLRLSEILSNRRTGEGHTSLKEKREQELAKKEQEAREKAAAEKAAIPLCEVWNKYIDQCKVDGKKSCNREESLFALWISPTIGKLPLAEIAPIHLEKIKANMAKAELSPRSIHYCLAVVRQIFNFAIRHDLFGGENPTKKVKKPSINNRRQRFLTHEEANLVLEALKEKSLNSWRITLISLHCGLRFSEIARLQYGDIDLERNTILVRDPKNAKSRFAYLTEEVRQALLNIDPKGKSDLIFPDKNGGQRRAMSDTFDRVVDALKLNEGIADDRLKVCFHTCRHSFASWLVEGGEDLIVVKELMGHKSMAMTERYSHLSPHTLQRASKNLDKRLIAAKANGVNGQEEKIIELHNNK